ncbi:MAG TPA: hypothetical protein VFB72_10365 [Verrucomicrobiae bacterium]|nr:hypothetical protein [Verrucomicrobiae bacterium]
MMVLLIAAVMAPIATGNAVMWARTILLRPSLSLRFLSKKFPKTIGSFALRSLSLFFIDRRTNRRQKSLLFRFFIHRMLPRSTSGIAAT